MVFTETIDYFYGEVRDFLLSMGIIQKESQFKISKLNYFEHCIESVLRNLNTDDVYEFTYGSLIFKVSASIAQLTHYYQVHTIYLDEHYRTAFFIAYDKYVMEQMFDDIDDYYTSLKEHSFLYKEFKQALKDRMAISLKAFKNICKHHQQFRYRNFNYNHYKENKEVYINDFISKTNFKDSIKLF